MVSARNAMDDANAAAQLSMTTPTRTVDEMLKARSDQYAGDKLYQQVMKDAEAEMLALRKVDDVAGCFIAGTLIHTKDGLTPIERIKVGAWVLSKPEGGVGETTYKQVVNTFSFADKEIWLVRFYKDGNDIEQVGVTANHLFWVKDVGWTRADQLGMGTTIELADGTEVTTICGTPILRTSDAGVGSADRAWGLPQNDGSVYRVVFDGNKLAIDLKESFIPEAYNEDGTGRRFTAQVFNFEVDEFHTYYVDEKGVWVHNTNCGDIGAAQVEVTLGVRPSPKTRVYGDGTTGY